LTSGREVSPFCQENRKSGSSVRLFEKLSFRVSGKTVKCIMFVRQLTLSRYSKEP
jgi:hypothetical protein